VDSLILTSPSDVEAAKSLKTGFSETGNPAIPTFREDDAI